MNNPNYVKLKEVFESAYEQAAEGKGKERHATDNRFEDQPIFQISRMINSEGGLRYQVIKKVVESSRLDPEKSLHELKGALVYTAALMILIQEKIDAESNNERTITT